MSWTFKSTLRSNVVPHTVQMDFEKEVKKINQFEEVNKKLHKELKRYMDSVDSVYKGELKLVNNLSNLTAKLEKKVEKPQSEDEQACASLINDFNAKLNDWKQVLSSESSKTTETLKQTCQMRVTEPLKSLGGVFPNVHAAIKNRDKSYNELMKQHAKLEKMQEKERTGPNVVKLAQIRHEFNQMKDTFQKENASLMQELPKLYNSRIDYIYPCVRELVHAQMDFFGRQASMYDTLLANDTSLKQPSAAELYEEIVEPLDACAVSETGGEDEASLLEGDVFDKLDLDMQKCLDEIRNLSIVAEDWLKN